MVQGGKGPTAATRDAAPVGGMNAPTRNLVVLDREVLHRPIGKASLRGLEENGGCPRNRLARRLLDTLNCETDFWDCGHWS